MRAALPALLALGPAAVLLKGGHLDGDTCDVFADGTTVAELRAPRIPRDLRGTGFAARMRDRGPLRVR